MKDHNITKTLEVEKKFLTDKQARYIYDLREKAKKDLFSSIAHAEERGEQRGVEKATVDIAVNLLQLGADANMIQKATGLSPQAIDKIKYKSSL